MLALIHLGYGVQSSWRQADNLHHGRHGVGGILAATSTGARTSCILNFQQFKVTDLAGRIRTNGFEYILNGYVFALVSAGQNGATVQHHSRYVQA